MTTLDIIVPAFNNPDITSRCLAALNLYRPKGSRVILVDNGSTDSTQDLWSQVDAMGGTYIRLDDNVGPYGAVNAGIRAGDSDLVAVVCNDVVVMPGSLQALVSTLRPELGIPLLGAFELGSAEFDWHQLQGEIAISGLRESVHLQPVQGFFSCFVAMRQLFDEDSVGLFDERFGLTFGDTDWEERYREAGFTYYRALHAPVYHGRSVGRKRGGLDADVANDSRDHAVFLEKWAGNDDVLSRHGVQSRESKLTATAAAWQHGEQ